MASLELKKTFYIYLDIKSNKSYAECEQHSIIGSKVAIKWDRGKVEIFYPIPLQ